MPHFVPLAELRHLSLQPPIAGYVRALTRTRPRRPLSGQPVATRSQREHEKTKRGLNVSSNDPAELDGAGPSGTDSMDSTDSVDGAGSSGSHGAAARGASEEAVDVVVEIPQGSRNKYEVDHASGRIRLDRTLFTSTIYPADLGSCRTLSPRTGILSTCWCSSANPPSLGAWSRPAR